MELIVISSGSAILSAAQWANEKMRKSMDCVNEFSKADDLNATPGDLIEFRRNLYDHWGVYIGGGYIIDLVNLGNGRGVVRREILSQVAEDGLCRVNNLVKAAKERGLKARSDNAILKAAFDKLDEELEYNALDYNCEHFATECFYGEGFSLQADIARNIPVVEVGSRLLSPSKS